MKKIVLGHCYTKKIYTDKMHNKLENIILTTNNPKISIKKKTKKTTNPKERKSELKKEEEVRRLRERERPQLTLSLAF